MGSQPHRNLNYSDWHMLMKSNLVALLFIKKIKTCPLIGLHTIYGSSNYVRFNGNSFRTQQRTLSFKPVQYVSQNIIYIVLYRRDETSFKCFGFQLENIINASLIKAPWTHWDLASYAYKWNKKGKRKKKKMSICTVHLLLGIIQHSLL